MSYHRRSLGASSPEPAVTVLDLQRQINRFPMQVPVTGLMDDQTAMVAVQLMIDRYQRAYDTQPNSATLSLLRVWQQRAQDPRPWVVKELAQIVDTIRDFANFAGRPPLTISGGSSARKIALVAAAIAALVIVTNRPRRRRR